jgi:hypothetical protein
LSEVSIRATELGTASRCRSDPLAAGHAIVVLSVFAPQTMTTMRSPVAGW